MERNETWSKKVELCIYYRYLIRGEGCEKCKLKYQCYTNNNNFFVKPKNIERKIITRPSGNLLMEFENRKVLFDLPLCLTKTRSYTWVSDEDEEVFTIVYLSKAELLLTVATKERFVTNNSYRGEGV